MAKFNDTNFDDSKLKRGSILYSSKISPVVEGEYALFNAYNMSWEGYKFGDSNEITYTGQVIAEIDKKATTTSLKNLEETVNSLQTKSADYYEQRWRTAGKEETVNAPEKTDLTVDVDDVTWHLTPQYESGKHTWMTSRKVVYVLNDSAYFKQYYDEPWSTPMKMTGNDGSVAYPVHQVLLYKWTDSRDVPTIDTTSSEKPEGWQESPGNGTPNTYLWMIQGQRQDSNYIKWDTDGDSGTEMTYWSSPICLSGSDGKPGKDGTDVEFIYKKFTSEQSFINDDNNPANWDADQTDDYRGPAGYTWNNNPEGVSSSYPYEYSSIRYKTDGLWGTFIQPFLWSKYGEDGLDGDGVEYIYYLCNNESVELNKYPLFWSNDADFDNEEYIQANSEWTDNPSGTSSEQKYEYVSVRKYKRIKNNNDILYLLFDTKLLSTLSAEYNKFLNTTDWEERPGPDITLLDYIFNICENDCNGISSISSDTLREPQSDWYDKQAIGNDFDLYRFIYDVLSKYFDYEYYEATYDQGLETCTYFKLIEKNDKFWTPYYKPALWAKYAEDGLATNLVLEADNDNITIGVTSEGTVNNNYSDSVNFTLVYNTKPLTLGDDYTLKILTEPTASPESDYNPFGIKTDTAIPFNTDLFQGNFASLTNNTLTVNIPEGFDMSQYNYIMSITLEAKIIRDDIVGLEINTPVIFTLKISGVELSINDIYKLNIDRQVIKLNPNNEAYDTINISLKSLTSNNSITSQQDAAAKHLYIRYNVDERNNIDPDANLDNIDNKLITVFQHEPSKYYNKHTFRLYYILDDSFIKPNDVLTDTVLNEHNAVLLDAETISAVYDGANGNPGTDSKSQEYIYFLCDEFGKTFTGDENPATWSSNKENYQTDDYPFIGTNGANILNNGWTDHPQGISETQRYEYIATRTYDTSTKTWGAFSEPVTWANCGHSGEDGDGVEYIYAVGNNADWKTSIGWSDASSEEIYKDPRRWVWNTNKLGNFKLEWNDNYQSTHEYRGDTTVWKDNPFTNLQQGQYQFVSVRKYKKLTAEYINSLTADDLGIFGDSSAELSNVKDIFQNHVNGYVWLPYSEPTIWGSNIKGSDGNDGEDAYVLDWTNDQINLAVDENGKIKPNQTKSTTLKTNSDNIKISSVNINTTLPFTCDGNVIYGKYNISFKIAPDYNNDYPIPENGIEVTFTVTLTNNKTLTKVLNICGQHIPSDGVDGQNAVTYEILSSANSATRNTANAILPSAVTLSALKYSGTDITTLTSLPEYLKFTYVFGNDSNISIEYDVDNTYTFNLISTAHIKPSSIKPGSPSVGNESEISGEETNNSVIANEIPGTAEQSGVQKTSLIPGVEIGGVEGGDVVAPGNVSFKVLYTNVYLSYLYNNVWKHIDVETIPIIDHGEKGAQGFTGPVVRMRGEFKERDTGGYYSDGSAQKNYDESTDGIRYKDIVWYNNQYWTPNPEKCDVRSADGVQASYVTRHTGVIACYDPEDWPGGEASYWVPATQFDFVATKLLYADQALINQISTHDLIATNQNGYPVAGVTSGSKMYDKDNTEITSYLSTLGTVQYSENAENDSSNVRIFAGEIWNGISYSLTYAPFNVRQDGTAYMSKANIEGTVTASNLKLKENVSANTQDQNGSFTYWDILNESRYVPILNDGEVGLYYILSIYGNNNNIHIKTPSSDNAFFKKSINGKSVLSNNDSYMIPPKNTLCQLVGINADNITYWNIIETPLAEQKIPDTILEHYDCTNDVILFAYNYEDYNSNGETINYFCTRPNDYDSFTPIRNITFDGDKMTSSTDIWVEYTFLTYLESDSYKHTTNGAYANLGSLKYIKPDYKSPDSEGGSIDPGK